MTGAIDECRREIIIPPFLVAEKRARGGETPVGGKGPDATGT